MKNKNETSLAWYIVPVFFSILGGVIGYFMLKKKDPELAKAILVVGVLVFALQALSYFTGFPFN